MDALALPRVGTAACVRHRPGTGQAAAAGRCVRPWHL